MGVSWGDIPRLIVSVIIPPVGVFQAGCIRDFVINVLLTVLGYIPGIVHAVYLLISKH